MIASLRRDLRGVSSLISASMTATGAGFTVSFTGATAALAPALFFVTAFPLPTGFFTVRGAGFFLGVVCASAVPAATETTRASRHNLIKCFFISLGLIL